MSASSFHYCIDTSCLINMADNYPYDLFPGLWDRMESLVESGEMLLHRIVRDELIRKAEKEDYASVWIRKFSLNQLVDIDADQSAAVQWMGAQHKQLGNIWAQENYMDKADPFLIACAVNGGHLLVTDEGSRDWKIPYICDLFDVRSCNLFGFMREVGWTFS